MTMTEQLYLGHFCGVSGRRQKLMLIEDLNGRRKRVNLRRCRSGDTN